MSEGAAGLTARGREDLLRALLAGLERGEAQRTLLFSGPEGVGRRGAALWLCAYLNCLAAPAERPCGRCAECVAAAEVRSLDLKVVEPQAESRTGRAKLRPELKIDQLVPRDAPQADPDPLGPWLAARPQGRYRVGVIADAHLMNESAANAFLKTLEEPPPRALVVLVAPGPEALLPTVASRAVNVRFGAVPVAAPDLEGHPGARLGQPGLLAKAREHREATAEARDAAAAFLASVRGGVLGSLEGAEALAKAVAAAHDSGAEPGPQGWLRELLRDLPPDGYAAALDLVDAYEDALAAYANAALAAAVLALRLRELLLALPDGPSVARLAG